MEVAKETIPLFYLGVGLICTEFDNGGLMCVTNESKDILCLRIIV